MALVELHFCTRSSRFLALVVKDVAEGMTSSFQSYGLLKLVSKIYQYAEIGGHQESDGVQKEIL